MKLFETDNLTSSRHFPSWLLLTFGAGSVNAASFFACRRFVSHVTGTATHLGGASSARLMLDYGLVLLSFLAGAAFSVVLLEARRRRGQRPITWAPLAVVSALLVVVSAAGHVGAFGPFGETVETANDFVLLAALSFAMGLQNAAVATTTANAVRSTHMTGPATDLALACASLLYARGEERARAVDAAVLRGGKLVAFVLGAAMMVPAVRSLEYLAFLVPAVAITIANLRSYVKVELPAPAAAAAR
ncbi:MAG: DUF1275 domain-containing protein [Myxococcales bacterium]|nr:DUF1275 domain-containing protein [Myxococcales bacterium]